MHDTSMIIFEKRQNQKNAENRVFFFFSLIEGIIGHNNVLFFSLLICEDSQWYSLLRLSDYGLHIYMYDTLMIIFEKRQNYKKAEERVFFLWEKE